MELEKPGILGIIGAILSIVGVYFFLSLDLEFGLVPQIQINPIIGGIIAGIGFSLLIFERNVITTIITGIALMLLGIVNWWSIGFGLGILVPGLTGKAKSLPIYLTALIIFVGTVFVVSSNPDQYRDMFLDNITSMTYENLGNLQEGIRDLASSQIDMMLPSRSDLEGIAASIIPCNNSSIPRDLCLQARENLANQMYEEMHSPEVKDRITENLVNVNVSKSELREYTAQIPMVQKILEHLPYVLAGIRTGWFLLFALSISIPQGILDFFLGLMKSRTKE